ncbi:thiol peroxidase [Enterobacter sp. CGMCC 5087]|uniref:thiol peroxidase n=1 Tax=Enterobacter sp. CGMCC 5087 TaxID=2183878 RepID=UPI000D674EB5|nr:thiol peroxidase [Enterobacter sp. CGMCC 5087]PWI77114.1 thiol peroxidase [Enterobacter sp. CGMCC 5087]
MSDVVYFQGEPVRTEGSLPARGARAPDFILTGKELNNVSLSDFAGKRKILSMFPSVDTGVCAASVRAFNRLVADGETVVLCISADLPFAQSRFCGAEGLENVVMLSSFRAPAFRTDYGVGLTEGALAGLMARAVVVLDRDNTVLGSDFVREITDEPDYDAILALLR